MKKMVYIAQRCERKDTSDIWDVAVTFDLEEARAACKADWEHMTRFEQIRNRQYIEGYMLDVEDGETAGDAYNRAIDNDELCRDPNYYEEMGAYVLQEED